MIADVPKVSPPPKPPSKSRKVKELSSYSSRSTAQYKDVTLLSGLDKMKEYVTGEPATASNVLTDPGENAKLAGDPQAYGAS